MAFGIGIGSVGGFISAMLIFAFAATLRAAYPPWDHGWPAVLEIVVMALVAATALLTPVRNPESTESARALGYAAFATLALFVGGEFLDVIHVGGVHTPFRRSFR